MTSTPICPQCDRRMFSKRCAFCAGKCGALTKSGKPCKWPQADCPVAAHSIYREYSQTELAMWKREAEAAPVQAEPKHKQRTHKGSKLPRGAFYGRKTAREMDIPV